MKNLEKRIAELELKYGSGTILSRVYVGTGYKWSLGLGKICMPKIFYTADTIEEVFCYAEKVVNEEMGWKTLTM